MTLDHLDSAFVRRWQTLTAAPEPLPPAPSPREPAVQASDSAAPAAEVGPVHDPSVVERLLAAAAPQCHAIADRVEAARGRGRRVIGIAGCDRGEGRTTIVAALARTLRDRGRDVATVMPADLPGDAGPAHDKRIVLVDAGVWFPRGPIRRNRLLVASYGCDAAIVVRRADRPAAPAIEAALEAIGVEPLGEVVTFIGLGIEQETAA